MKTVMRTVLCALALAWATTTPAAETTTSDDIDFATEVAFEQALEERENGDLDKAIEAFNAILADHPQLHRVRYALAVAYYQGFQYARARAEAEQAMQASSTPDEAKLQIQNFLDRLNAADVRQKWNGSILAGLIADSNVNVAPDDSLISLPGGGTLQLPNDATSADDIGLLIQASAQHRYLAANTQHVGGKEAAFMWQSRADIFSATYSEETGQDTQLIKLETGPAQLFGRDMQIRVRALLNQLWLGGDSYLTVYGLRPAFSLTSKRNGLTAAIDADIQQRDYLLSADDSRDSGYVSARLLIGYGLPNTKSRVYASIMGFHEGADASYYTRDGRTYALGIRNQISAHSNFMAHAQWTEADYGGIEPGYSLARNDRIIRWGLALEHQLTDTPLKDWSLVATLNHSRNITNVPTYTYRRNQALIALKRSF